MIPPEMIQQVMQQVQMVGQTGAQFIQDEDSSGRMKAGSAAAKAGLSNLGPMMGVAALSGFLQAKKQNKEMGRMQRLNTFYEGIAQAQQGIPEEETEGSGTGYYKNGGFLRARQLKVQGGKLQSLSSHALEVQGKTHEQGGVKLGPNEVEDGETLSNGYVFSEHLGFAQAHKKLMRPLSRIEQKPPTPERLNSIRGIMQQEKDLRLKQELFKTVLNGI
jgi:hypothetical protein